MFLSRLATVASICAGSIACAPSLPNPVITEVEPSWAYNGERQRVDIFGEHFYPLVELDVRDDGGRLDRQFGVSLESAEESFLLEGVSLVSYEQLEADVPAGFPTGRYTLVVTSPQGSSARLPQGFTITDTRADHLSIDIDGVAYRVEDAFTVHLALRDPADDILLQALDVALSITSESGAGPAALEVDSSSFDSVRQYEVDGGIELSFTLRAGDATRNFLTLTGHQPDTLDLLLRVTDPDSVVSPAEERIAITPHSLAAVRIDLPSEDFDTEAGESFELGLSLVDEFDNLIPDASATLFLSEACGPSTRTVNLIGQSSVEFVATGATNDDCPISGIVATGTVSGASEGFAVHPADAVGYDVTIFPNTITAVEEDALVTLRALDAYGNQVVSYGEDWLAQHGKPLGVVLVDEIGGLDPSQGHGTQSCPGFEGGLQICQANLDTAGEGDHLTATGEDGLEGRSGDFDVVPASLAGFELINDPPPYTAGTPFDLRVRPTDAYGNTIYLDPALVGYAFEGVPHAVTCENPVATVTAGEWSFECVATVAVAGQNIHVSIPSIDPDVAGDLGESFVVHNGALGLATLAFPGGSPQVAGAAFQLDLQVFDTYGNPYTVQSTTTVDLEDSTGTLDRSSMSFDTAGLGSELVTITQSCGGCWVEASDAGAPLGSASLEVLHAEPAALRIETERPWSFLGDPLTVEIAALDPYDNVAESFDELVELATAYGSAETVLIEGFELGRATTTVVFDAATLDEEFLAQSATGLEGVSSPVDALEEGCGIVVSLLVDGEAEPVMCTTGGTVGATLDASGSTGSITGYHFDDGAEKTVSGTSASTTTTWTSPGVYLVRAVAHDDSACGGYAETLAWVAEPDGEPAGPVEVTPLDSTRVVGSSTDGVTNVELQAYDCAGDVAAKGTLRVRTTLGEITGPSATGAGLELLLDSSGQGSFTWSVEHELRGGVSTLYAGREGIALGVATITATGDDAHPVVLDLDPVGSSEEITDTFILRFDEPMRPNSVNSSNVVLRDSTATVAASLGLDATSTVLTITADSALDLAADVYTLSLSDQVRDDSGNRLDGGWSGSSGAFSVQIGAVSDAAPQVLYCIEDTTVLRPDGDDSPGTDEADEVEVQVTASDTPRLWLLEIYDEDGEERLRSWRPAASTSELLSWDARGQDGVVLPNGVYTLLFSAADTNLNLGEPCALAISIDNTIVEVP